MIRCARVVRVVSPSSSHARGLFTSRQVHLGTSTGVSGRNPMLEPRYAGLGTFMRTPLVNDLSEIDIALVGVPYDGATEGRPGARHGPRDIRNMSSFMRAVHQVSKVNPYELARVGDVGDVPFDRALEVDKSHQQIYEFYTAVVGSGVVPLSAGGDHSISLPILRAVAGAAGQPLALFHFDAHCDTYDEELGSKLAHGTPFRRAVEEGLIDPKRTVQVGIRGAGNSEEAWSFSLDSGMRVLFMDECARIGVDAVIDEVRKIIGDAPAYCTFDVDGLDPVYAPGTGTPEVGGFTTIEAQRILRGLRGVDFVGGDVVEVSPPWDPSGNTSLVGATMMYEILCLLAESWSKRSKQV